MDGNIAGNPLIIQVLKRACPLLPVPLQNIRGSSLGIFETILGRDYFVNRFHSCRMWWRIFRRGGDAAAENLELAAADSLFRQHTVEPLLRSGIAGAEYSASRRRTIAPPQ